MFDQQFDYLNAGGQPIGGRPLIKGFRYAVGDTPQPIAGFGTAGIWGNKLKIFCGEPHGLRAGNKVYINVLSAGSELTKEKLQGSHVVSLTGGALLGKNDDWFVIPVNAKEFIGENITGTWQLASSYVAPPLVCDAGYHKEGDKCVKDIAIDPNTGLPVAEKMGLSDVPAVVWYIAGGLALITLGVYAFRRFKHKAT